MNKCAKVLHQTLYVGVDQNSPSSIPFPAYLFHTVSGVQSQVPHPYIFQYAITWQQNIVCDYHV